MTLRARALLRPLAILTIGGLLGGLVAGRLCYNRPGRSVLNKYLIKVGLREGNYDLYGYDPDLYGSRAASADWSGVRSPAYPQWKVRRGFDVELVATGFTYPVSIAFASKAPRDADDPLFYVTELHGTVKVVTRSGEVHTFAEGLINFEPDESHFAVALSDECGITGISAVPSSEDLLVTGSYREAASGLLKNRVLYVVSEPGGLSMRRFEVMLDVAEYTSPSHQIQSVKIAPDGSVFVSVGDGQNYRNSLDLSRYGGKILRLELDGGPCEDNPFYEPLEPDAPRGFVFAYGVRNVFDFDFHPETGDVFAVDNGHDLDRLIRVQPGGSYAWDGRPDSIKTNALYVWGGPEVKNTSPTGVTFVRGSALGAATLGKLLVALFAPYGPRAKAIVEFSVVAESGMIDGPPCYLVQYAGETKATVLGLAEGPDGVYFTDFWGETTESSNRRGNVWKLVASDATLSLADVDEEAFGALEPAARGEMHFQTHCATCHRVDDIGGREGPDLSDAANVLELRLNSKSYDATIAMLLASDASFFVAQRPRLERVRARGGEERVRVWLTEHITEPRFDNPNARMPGSDLADGHKQDLIEYVMTLRQ